MKEWTDWVTFGLASLGAVLGIANTIKSWRQDKLRLYVRFVYAVTSEAPIELVGIEVRNLSAFAVTIEEVGLLARGMNSRTAFAGATLTDQSRLPCRLHSRESMTALFDASCLPRANYDRVYARTACGEFVQVRQKDLPSDI